MKKIFYTLGALMLLSTTFTGCKPQEMEDYEMQAAPSETNVKFAFTPQVDKPNRITFKNQSTVPGIAVWDFGNGQTGKGNEVVMDFPLKGEYLVKLTLYTNGGSAESAQTITIAATDASILDTEMYNFLTGGLAKAEGKTWVFDSYHAGHFGVGPAGGTSPEWWVAQPEDKLKCSLYKNEFTFKVDGTQMIWTNKDSVYTNKLGLDKLGGASSEPPAGDFDVYYKPKASYTFTLNENAKTLTLSDGAFVGHYTGSSTYQILKLTEDELYLKVISAVEPGNAWYYRFVPKEKHVKPVVTIENKGVALAEDFQAAEPKLEFVKQDMGDHSGSYANPAPVPLNTSSTVYLYEKSTAFYSNLSWVAPDYKFDLSEVNKVKMKVFIPTYNDYATEADVAGDWVAVKTLQPTVAVKLQNNDLGGQAYSTQFEIVKTINEKGKWIEVEFDFSNVKDRKDFNKIVIQFGGEGHAAPGIFFFDDFSFSK